MSAVCDRCRLVQSDSSGCRLCAGALTAQRSWRLRPAPRRWRPPGAAEAVGGRIRGDSDRALLRVYELVDSHGALLLLRIELLAELTLDTNRGPIAIEGPLLVRGGLATGRWLPLQSWGPLFGIDGAICFPRHGRLVSRHVRGGDLALARGPAVLGAEPVGAYRDTRFALQALRGRPGQPVVLRLR